MRRLFTLSLLLLSTMTLATGFSMTQYQWQQRPLLVFAPDAEHPAYRQTLQAIDNHADGFSRRDMVLISVFGNNGHAADTELSSTDVQQLRETYAIANQDFRVLLIGKDGGIKSQSSHTADMDALFRLIDSMPMRQREMRDSH